MSESAHYKTLDEFNEIIAIRFWNDVIHFGKKALDLLNESVRYKQLLSRAEFRLMNRLDLGDKWGKYADIAPTLFLLNKEVPFSVRCPMYDNY